MTCHSAGMGTTDFSKQQSIIKGPLSFSSLWRNKKIPKYSVKFVQRGLASFHGRPRPAALDCALTQIPNDKYWSTSLFEKIVIGCCNSQKERCCLFIIYIDRQLKSQCTTISDLNILNVLMFWGDKLKETGAPVCCDLNSLFSVWWIGAFVNVICTFSTTRS